jgi:hypothetical protein
MLVAVEALDDFGITSVRLKYQIDGGPTNTIDLVLDGALREPDAEMDVGADMDAATDADSSGDVGTADGGVQDDTTLPGDAADIDEPGPIGPSTPPDTGCAVSGEAPERGALVLCMLLVGAAALRSPRVRL